MIVRDPKTGKVLYAVAFSKLLRSRTTGKFYWKPGFIEYVHARDESEARSIITRTNRTRIDIVAAGPMIGAFVKDKHGEQLSAT